MRRGLTANFGLRAAWARVEQAQTLARRAGADLRPAVDGSAGLSRQAIKTSGASPERTYATELAVGLAASYELDLWGRLRAERAAARLDAEATAEDLQATAVTLTAEIAVTWLRRLEAQGQLRLLGAQAETDAKYLAAISARFQTGQATAADVLQQQQLVQAKRGERAQVLANVALLEHQLAVLVGEVPGTLDMEFREELPTMPELPAAGVPLAWTRRRPDLRAAEARVRAADRRAAAALADRFPRLALSLQASTNAERVGALFDNWLAGLAANLTAPLLDGGTRRAESARTRAAAAAALHDYGQTMLLALGDVEGALVREARLREYAVSLDRELALAAEATARTRANYLSTGTDFTRYLLTLKAYQALERKRLETGRNLLEARIGLYRALAGGWDLPRPEADARSTTAPNQKRQD